MALAKLSELLGSVKDNTYAIGSFNVSNMEMAMGAIKAAETGHLVFSTLHTNDSIQTINRIINLFEPHQRNYITTQLANIMRGVISQKLIPKADGNGPFSADPQN